MTGATVRYARNAFGDDGIRLLLDVAEDLERASRSAATTRLVEGTIALAHRVDVEVVVEGVETAEQLRTVRGLGAEYAQGYLLGRPAPNHVLLARLAGEAPLVAAAAP